MSRSARIVFLLVALAIAALAGCHLLLPQSVRPVGGPMVVSGGVGAAVDSRKGVLDISIRWPRQDYPGYKVSAIPFSTRGVIVRVLSPSSVQLGQAVLVRDAGPGEASASVEVDAGANLGVEVKAFRDVPTYAGNLATASALVAQGFATVNVNGGQRTKAKVILEPLFVPAIASMSANAGAVGDEIVLYGSHFEASASLAPTVTFAGVAAATVSVEVPDGRLRVKVPSGATVGRVTVTADGITSTSDVVYWVATALGIDAQKAAWDSGPSGTWKVLPSQSLFITASPSWTLPASGDPGGWPLPGWDLGDPAAGTMAATASYGGLFSAGGAIKNTTVVGRLGSITSNSLTLSVQDATVSITPATGSLGPAGESEYVKFMAVNTFSDGSTNSLATFSSGNAKLVDVNQTTGTAVAGTDAPSSYGSVEIKATLKGDDRRSARATVDVANYEVSTYAGSLPGADGTGAGARFNGPNGIVLDGDGNVYVADTGNRKIRKITPEGVVTTLAGSGTRGSQDGTGTAAQFVVPYDLAMAGQSPILLVSDLSGVRKIVVETAAVTTVPYPTPAPYIVETDPPTFPSLAARGTDGPSDPYLAYANLGLGSAILKAGVRLAGNFMEGDQLGDATTALFRRPLGLARGLDSSLLIADERNHKIKKLEGGQVTLVAGSTQGFANGPDSVAKFSYPRGLTVDGGGNVFVADTGNHRIRKIDTGGNVTSYAGSSEGYQDGAVAMAKFKSPSRVAVHSDGTLFVSDTGNNRIRKISGGTVSTLAGGDGNVSADGPRLGGAGFDSPFDVTFDALGNMFVLEAGSHAIRRIAASGLVSTIGGASGSVDGDLSQARFESPSDLATDREGNVLVVDANGLRKISSAGSVSTLAASSSFLAVAPGPDGAIYVSKRALYKFSSSGALIEGIRSFQVDARVFAVLGDGSILVQYSGGLSCAICKVSQAGVETTYLAIGDFTGDGPLETASGNNVVALVRDGEGNGYFLQHDVYGGRAIRRISRGGIVSTLWSGSGATDGIGSAAGFGLGPGTGLALSPAGDLYVADRFNNLIRKIRKVP